MEASATQTCDEGHVGFVCSEIHCNMIGKLVIKALRRLANVGCAISLDITADGDAKVSCSEVMCDGRRCGDSAKVSYSEVGSQGLVMAEPRQVLVWRSVKVFVA